MRMDHWDLARDTTDEEVTSVTGQIPTIVNLRVNEYERDKHPRFYFLEYFGYN